MSDTTIVLQFFLGEDEDTSQECSYQMSEADALPRVGDAVSFWGTRDNKGNYVYDSPEKQFEGIVTRIEHTYEQHGTSSSNWRMTHFIQVFMKPLPPQLTGEQ